MMLSHIWSCEISKEINLSSRYIWPNWRFHKIELLYISRMQKIKTKVQKILLIHLMLLSRGGWPRIISYAIHERYPTTSSSMGLTPCWSAWTVGSLFLASFRVVHRNKGFLFIILISWIQAFHLRCLLRRRSHPPSLCPFQLLGSRDELRTTKSIAYCSGSVDSILYCAVGDHANGDDTLCSFQDENQ